MNSNKHSVQRAVVSIRAVIIGLFLIPFNAYWIWGLEVVRYTHPTLVVPFSNVMFILLIATALSFLLRKLHLPLALHQGELLVLYMMLSTASALASIDMLQILISNMGHAFWFATTENEWKDLFWKYLPDWLVVRDTKTLSAYYKGNSSFYRLEYLSKWATPLLWWGLFTSVLIFVMLCINSLLRKQWVEKERLTYPIVQLPLEVTENSGRFFRNKLMWMGFGLAAGISIINGLSYFYPAIPRIPVKRRSINYLFTEKPWNMMGGTRISFYPFVIGIGFLIPLDLLFSAWVFYCQIGAESGYFGPWALGLGRGTFNGLQNWLHYPTTTNYLSITFMIVGLIVASFLMFLRTRFLWWTLHPLGYVLARDWGMYNLWSCIFLNNCTPKGGRFYNPSSSPRLSLTRTWEQSLFHRCSGRVQHPGP